MAELWRVPVKSVGGEQLDRVELTKLETIQKLVHYSPVHGMVEYANAVESSVERA